MPESKFDPKIIGEFLNFSRNLAEAPMKVSVPHEVKIGSTQFDVVYKEDKIRLLHFKPLTEKQVRTPLLISYAIVNRYHIFDIDPKKSWVRNLLEQGFDVYLIDWGTPTKIDQFLGFDEYVNGYMDNCVDFICKEAGVDKVSIQGYCTGGTLATVYSSLHPDRVKNLIVTAPVIDGWKDTTVVSNIAKYFDVDKLVDTVGNMPPEFIYFCFSILKPFEQGVEKYIKFLNNIDNEKYVDSFLKIEKWLDETPPIPGELFRQWIKGIYQDNLLIQNKMYVKNKLVSLENLNMPIFTQVAVGDHLVSPECSMPLHYAVSSTDKTLKLYPTGHVGMIASSFSQKTAVKARLNVSDLQEEHAQLIVKRSLILVENQSKTHDNKKPTSVLYRWRSDPRLRTISPYRLTPSQGKQLLKDIKCPVQLIYGDKGMSMVIEGLSMFSTSLKDFTAIKISGGHHVHMEQTEQLCNLVNNFYQVNEIKTSV